MAQAPAQQSVPENPTNQAIPSAPTPPSEDQPNGKVVFSRSAASSLTPAPAQGQSETALAASVTDAMRLAPTMTAYDFTLHLQPASAGLEAQLRLTLRNDSAAPLPALALQLSSSLHFERIRLGAQTLHFIARPLASDADHTGTLTEAAVALPAPLAPGASLTLTIDYSGAVPQSSQRLDQLGTPAQLAAQSDWDRIGPGFTGLRGFGNTVWYPVASTPALLGQGAQLFQQIARQKQHNRLAVVSMALTVEFPTDAPTVAVLDGHSVPLGPPAALPTAGFPGVLRLTLPPTVLGFAVPSVVLAARSAAGANPFAAAWALPTHEDLAAAYLEAGSRLQPLYASWFAAEPTHPVQLIDLPVEGASPAEDGDALLLSLAADPPARLGELLSGPLTHGFFNSPRAWLDQGVPGWMAALWTERTAGRPQALAQISGSRAVLALAEPATPGASAGQPLIGATAPEPIFARTKAVYVLSMLRSLVGDDVLASALRAYDPASDTTPGYFESLVQAAADRASRGSGRGPGDNSPDLGATPGAPSAGTIDLHWFFTNWVYRDLGLPDLSIANVFPSRTGTGDQWLVAITLRNAGYTEAQVPVTVHSALTATTVPMRVPARGEVSRRVLLIGEPTEVDVNDGSVPEVEASTHQRLLTILPPAS